MRFLTWSLLLLVTASLLACPPTRRPGDDDDDNDDSTTPTPTPTPVFEPEQGHWTYSNLQFQLNECNVDPGDLATGGFTLNNTADGVFTVTNDDGGQPATCYLTDQSYTCDPVVTDLDLASEGLTAILTTTQNGTGTFPTATTIQSTAAVVVACAGQDCWLAELAESISFPCSIDFTLDGTAD